MFDGGELSYGDLDAQAQIVANGLVRLGIGTRRFVSVGMDPSFELIISLVAIIKTNGVYFCLDRRYPRERQHALLKVSGARFFLESIAGDGYSGNAISGEFKATIIGNGPDNGLSRLSHGDVSRCEQELCNIYCTSAALAFPKPLLGTLKSITNRFEWFSRILHSKNRCGLP